MNWRDRLLRKRLSSFETIFQKHAEICPHCRALIVWPLGDLMPSRCRRCDRSLTEERDEESSIYGWSYVKREILH